MRCRTPVITCSACDTAWGIASSSTNWTSYYGQDVREFQQMIRKNRIDLPAAVTKGIDEAGMSKMIDTALGLEPLWKKRAWRALEAS
jgi:hypothetical protein